MNDYDDYTDSYDDEPQSQPYGEPPAVDAQALAEQRAAETTAAMRQAEQRRQAAYQADLDAIEQYTNGPGGYLVANPDYLKQLDAVVRKHGGAGVLKEGWA